MKTPSAETVTCSATASSSSSSARPPIGCKIEEVWEELDAEDRAAFYEGFAAGMAYDGDEDVEDPSGVGGA